LTKELKRRIDCVHWKAKKLLKQQLDCPFDKKKCKTDRLLKMQNQKIVEKNSSISNFSKHVKQRKDCLQSEVKTVETTVRFAI